MSDVETPNPYRKSAVRVVRSRNDDDLVQRSRATLVTPAVMVFVTFFASIVAPMFIDDFNELYRGFGAELPAVTRFVVATRYGWGVFFLASVAMIAWVGAREQQTLRELRLKGHVITVLIILFAAAVMVTFYSLYLPIIKMGQVV